MGVASQTPMVTEAYTQAFNRNLLEAPRYIFNDPANEYDKIARVQSTDRLTNEFQATQGLSQPRLARDFEPLPETAPVTGYKTNIRIQNYKTAVWVEETLMRTAVFDGPVDNARDMMRSTVTLKDKTVVDFFNNGFTDNLPTNITEYDGTARAAFSTGHYYENGASTWSNYYNVGLPPNPDTVYTLIFNYLKRLKDFTGNNYVNYGQDFIIVTPTLTPSYGMAAQEIIQSMDRPDTANRATNVLRSGIRLSHLALNQLTSSTKWFLIVPPNSTNSYPLRDMEMISYDVTPLQMLTAGGNPDVAYTRCRTQFGVGYSYSYRGITACGS